MICAAHGRPGDPATKKSRGYTTNVVIDHEALVRGNAVDGERAAQDPRPTRPDARQTSLEPARNEAGRAA
jgi:hypothetical protein